MQVVWRDAKVVFGRWRNIELAPKGIDVLLLVISSSVLHHVESGGRMCAIRTNEEVKRNF